MSRADVLPEAAVTAGRKIMIVDDDSLFRESLSQNLTDSGYAVECFEDGSSFLDRIADAPDVHLVLLDWKMPRMNGIEVLSRLRQVAPDLPVIFLTVLSDQIYEEAALFGGAVDFVEKSRSFSIILRRIQLIPVDRGTDTNGVDTAGEVQTLDLDDLHLDLNAHRAYWRGAQVDLTLSEFGIVHALASNPGCDLAYRTLYDIVRGKGFIAGHGDEGYRANVRSAIKRIRRKFRDIDPSFDGVENYPGFGYRWRGQP